MNPDMVLSSPGPDVIMVAVKAMEISMAPGVVWPSDTNKVPGDNPELWHWCGLQRYCVPQTSTQTLAEVGPQTQTWPLVAAQISPRYL